MLDADAQAQELKNHLRLHFKKIRAQISPQRKRQASEKACRDLYDQTKHLLQVLSFASFGTEIDLWPLNKQLALEQKLILPRLFKRSLTLHQVMDVDLLETHPAGWKMPKSENLIMRPSQVSVILVPGLCFDTTSYHRLGYGKGYYDQLLKKMHEAKKWGIGFKEQETSNLITEHHDCALDQLKLY